MRSHEANHLTDPAARPAELPEGLSKMPNARNFLWNVVAPSFLGLLYREPPVSDNAMAMAMAM